MIEFCRDFWQYMRARKKFWMLPILFVLGLFGILIAVGHVSAVAPFIYAIF